MGRSSHAARSSKYIVIHLDNEKVLFPLDERDIIPKSKKQIKSELQRVKDILAARACVACESTDDIFEFDTDTTNDGLNSPKSPQSIGNTKMDVGGEFHDGNIEKIFVTEKIFDNEKDNDEIQFLSDIGRTVQEIQSTDMKLGFNEKMGIDRSNLKFSFDNPETSLSMKKESGMMLNFDFNSFWDIDDNIFDIWD